MTLIVRKGVSRYSILAMMVIGLAACDSATVVDSEIASSIEFISSDLQMDSDERVALETSFSTNDGRQSHEPGYLWYVAQTLHENLSDDQVNRLLDRLENRGSLLGRPGFNHGQGAGFGSQFRDRRGFHEFGGFAALGSFADQLGLTPEQHEAIVALRSAFRENLHSLRAAHNDGSLTDEEFSASLDELIAELRASWEDLLTDDQKIILEQMKADREAALAERRAQREADRAAARLVMIEVLGLSDAQVASLDDLRLTIDELRDAFQELIDSGATREEVKVWSADATAGIVDELSSILDETQFEIFVIHGALHSRVAMRLRQQHRRRPQRS